MLPFSGNEILIDSTDSAKASAAKLQPGAGLVSWVIGKVTPWERQRNSGYQRLWAEYWRMWRGKWSEEDKNRLSERSRLIAPALAQAIEMTVAEIDEAVFSKEVWFDIADDIADEEKVDALMARDQLLEDFDKVNAKDAISEAVLNAAIFGTGIVKVNVTVGRDNKPKRNQKTFKMERQGKDRVFVSIESVRPDEFIPDPSGRTIGEMLGAAHHVSKPLHSVLEKIENGTYRDDARAHLMPAQRLENSDVDDEDPQSSLTATDADQVDIVEYHGKVPLRLLDALTEEKTPLDEILNTDTEMHGDMDDGELVEAIVTVANGSTLLRAMVNPFVMQDRSFIAFQFEKVPGRFWGRGVSEKGYNPQKALDAEIRARIDALGFISSPMIGVDSGRIPKGFKAEIKPGKIWLTQGPPSEVLSPVQIGAIDANTFNQASEMERMVNMGTGAFDTASALHAQSQSGANSAGSNSMLMGAFVKRAKRSIQNVDRNLLTPIIEKSLWRYMQFDPRRYPDDYDFNVKATLGIVAREVEAMQLTQLIGMMPEQYGAVSLVLVEGIIEHTAVSNKAEIMKSIAAIKNPPPEVVKQQQEAQELQQAVVRAEAQGKLLENQKTMAETRKLLAEAMVAVRKAGVEDAKLDIEQQKLELASQELDQFAIQNKLAFEGLKLKDRELDIKEQDLAVKRTQKTTA